MLIIVLLAGRTTPVIAQSALDGFDPNANSDAAGDCRQARRQDSHWRLFYIPCPNGGPSVTRNRIARLNADGTLDPSFNPNANQPVYSLALQANGKILVGGAFSNIGGQIRNFMARLDPITGLADSFNPNPNLAINSIALQADGKILAAGQFTAIGGQTRNRIARLDPTAGLPTHSIQTLILLFFHCWCRAMAKSWREVISPISEAKRATGSRDSILPLVWQIASIRMRTIWSDMFAVQADGKIVVSGAFTTHRWTKSQLHRPTERQHRRG